MHVARDTEATTLLQSSRANLELGVRDEHVQVAIGGPTRQKCNLGLASGLDRVDSVLSPDVNPHEPCPNH
jgi:hypothetical protein